MVTFLPLTQPSFIATASIWMVMLWNLLMEVTAITWFESLVRLLVAAIAVVLWMILLPRVMIVEIKSCFFVDFN